MRMIDSNFLSKELGKIIELFDADFLREERDAVRDAVFARHEDIERAA